MIDAAVFAVLSVGVGVISIFGRSAALRAAAYAGLVVGMLALWYLSMGLPRPQVVAIPDGTVVGYRLDEPRHIYLWLVPNGSAQPLALALPWRDDVAGSLVDAARRRGNPADSLKITSARSGSGLRATPMFYVTHAAPAASKASERP